MNTALNARIASASKEQLVTLLTALAAGDYAVAAFLDGELAPPPPSRPAPLCVDRPGIARRVTGAIREAYRGRYPDPTMISREMEAVLAPADAAVEAGDARGALELHDAAWSALAGDSQGSLWQDECELSDGLDALGAKLARALLAASFDPSEAERWDAESWVEKIEGWQADLSGDALESSLDLAREAAESGWHAPEIRAALSGVLPRGALAADGTAWDRRRARRIQELRLECLEQRCDWDAYIHLARAAGLLQEEVHALLRAGRAPDAIQAAGEARSDCAESVGIAKLLNAAGEPDAALAVADQALAAESAGYCRGQLARWARDAAQGDGRGDRALEYAREAIRSDPALSDYLKACSLAGALWTDIRESVLKDVCECSSVMPQGKVEILLHEGEVDRAIAALGSYSGHELVGLVAEAAMESHPDWVFTVSVHQFNRIADRGKSQYYDAAASWMARAKAALRQAGRDDEWPALFADVLARHGRKHSLKPLLLKLR